MVHNPYTCIPMTTRPTPLLFQETEAPSGLLPAILARIALARRRTARFQLAAFGTVTFFSVLMFISAVRYTVGEFVASGFYDYASLFFDSLSRGYWREVLYSLTDSFPSFALLLLAAVSVACVWSVRRTNQSARIAFARVVVAA